MPRLNPAASGGTVILEPPAAPAANPVPVTAPAATAPKAAAPGALEKVSFCKIATKEDAKTAYPVFDNPQAAEIAAGSSNVPNSLRR